MSDELSEILGGAGGGSHEDQWISLSDLMTSLMLIFMLVAIAFMIKTEMDSVQMNADAATLLRDAKKRDEDAKKMQDAAQKMQEAAAKMEQIAKSIQSQQDQAQNQQQQPQQQVALQQEQRPQTQTQQQLQQQAQQAKQDATKLKQEAQHNIWDDPRIEQAMKKMEDSIAKMDEAVMRMEMNVDDAAAPVQKIREDYAKIQKIAKVYDEVKNELYSDLTREFNADLQAWGATITPDLTIHFTNPDVLFDRGRSDVKPSFQAILSNFFPRYLAIITSDKYKDTIQEIRIEGHTSSVWGANTSPDEAYFKNMELSQARTRSTLSYVMSLPQVQPQAAWLQRYLTANGLSSSHLIYNQDGTENELLSQRVEFRIRTDAEAKINNILNSVK